MFMSLNQVIEAKKEFGCTMFINQAKSPYLNLCGRLLLFASKTLYLVKVYSVISEPGTRSN